MSGVLDMQTGVILVLSLLIPYYIKVEKIQVLRTNTTSIGLGYLCNDYDVQVNALYHRFSHSL